VAVVLLAPFCTLAKNMAESDSESSYGSVLADDEAMEDIAKDEPSLFVHAAAAVAGAGAVDEVENLSPHAAEANQARSWFSVICWLLSEAGLVAAQQQRFLEGLQTASFEEGQAIVSQGAMGDRFFIVADGQVTVEETPQDGGPNKLLSRLHPGHHFGEYSVIKSQPRLAHVIARTPKVTCMYMTKEKFESLTAEDPSVAGVIEKFVQDTEETRRLRQQMQAQGEGSTTAVKFVSSGKRHARETAQMVKYKDGDGNLHLNEYVVQRKLGAGAYGTVFLCQNTAASEGTRFKFVAIKIVNKALLRKRRLGLTDEALMQEAEVMTKLQHENVVQMFEVINATDEDTLYIVQEFVEHGAVMQEEEFVEATHPDTARQYMRDTVRGLEYLHFQRVLHRDIKPSNILVDDVGAKLADFGTAKVLQRDDTYASFANMALRSSRASSPKVDFDYDFNDMISDTEGTPAFMAPELFADPIMPFSGRAADIWSLGATLYMMVVGTPPFMASSEPKLVERLLDPLDKPHWPSNLGPHLTDLLKRMLQKDPKQRATLAEIMQHEWLTMEGVYPLPPTKYVRVDASTSHGKLSRKFSRRTAESNELGSTNSSFRSRASPRHFVSSSASVRRRQAKAGLARLPLDEQRRKAEKHRLRRRQLQLLRGHADLTTADLDMMLEQKRVAIHANRATASVEDITIFAPDDGVSGVHDVDAEQEITPSRSCDGAAESRLLDHFVANGTQSSASSSSSAGVHLPRCHTASSGSMQRPQRGQQLQKVGSTLSENAAAILTVDSDHTARHAIPGSTLPITWGINALQKWPSMSEPTTCEYQSRNGTSPTEETDQAGAAFVSSPQASRRSSSVGHNDGDSVGEALYGRRPKSGRLFVRHRSAQSMLSLASASQLIGSRSPACSPSPGTQASASPGGPKTQTLPQVLIEHCRSRSAVRNAPAVALGALSAMMHGPGPAAQLWQNATSLRACYADTPLHTGQLLRRTASAMELPAFLSRCDASDGHDSDNGSGVSSPRSPALDAPAIDALSACRGRLECILCDTGLLKGSMPNWSSHPSEGTAEVGYGRVYDNFVSLDAELKLISADVQKRMSLNRAVLECILLQTAPKLTGLLEPFIQDLGDAYIALERTDDLRKGSFRSLGSMADVNVISSDASTSDTVSASVQSKKVSDLCDDRMLGTQARFVMGLSRRSSFQVGRTRAIHSPFPLSSEASLSGVRPLVPAMFDAEAAFQDASWQGRIAQGAPHAASGAGLQPARKALTRKQDFIMVTQNVGRRSEEGTVKKAVIFRATGDSGRLSIATTSGMSESGSAGHSPAPSSGSSGLARPRSGLISLGDSVPADNITECGSSSETDSDFSDVVEADDNILEAKTGTADIKQFQAALDDMLDFAPVESDSDEDLRALPDVKTDESDSKSAVGQQQSDSDFVKQPASAAAPPPVPGAGAGHITLPAAPAMTKSALKSRSRRRSVEQNALTALKRRDGMYSNFFKIACGAAEDQGARATMEDRSMMLLDMTEALGIQGVPPTAYFAVFDGHSGDAVSVALSERLHCVLSEQPDFLDPFGDVAGALADAFVDMDEEICNEQVELASKQTITFSGATACVAAFRWQTTLISPGISLNASQLSMHSSCRSMTSHTASMYEASTSGKPAVEVAMIPQSPPTSLLQSPRVANLNAPAVSGTGHVRAVSVDAAAVRKALGSSPGAKVTPTLVAAAAAAGASPVPNPVRAANMHVLSSGSSSAQEDTETVEELVLYIANAGDCRAVLSHKGIAVDLTKDHKPKEPSEKERIKAAGGWVHNGRLNGILGVSRAFGDVEHKTLKEESWGKEFADNPLTAEPEVTAIMLHEDDEFLILACDGLWDVMSSAQAVNFVRRYLATRNRDVQAASSALVSKAIALNTVDNVSCMVIALNQGDTDDSMPLPTCRELSTVNSVASGLAAARADGLAQAAIGSPLSGSDESDSEYSDGDLETL